MRKVLFFMLGVLMALPTFARDFKYTYEGNTVTYTVISESDKTVRTRWDNCIIASNVYGKLVLPSHPKDGDVEYTLITIGREGFHGQKYMTSITIPSTVTSIESSAFDGCSGLSKVEFNAKNCYLWYKDQSPFPTTLKTLTIGDEVEVIPAYLAYNCSNLTSVTIPNSVTSIGAGAFYYCRGLTSVTIPDNVTSIGSGAFLGCAGLKKAEFASLESLCKIDFENYSANPLFIAKHLYIGESEVRNLVIPESVSSIGAYAFYNSEYLTSVTIPNTVSSIGSGAFYNCSGLSSVIIPTSVSSIGSDAFKYCSGLKKSAYPKTISNPFTTGTTIGYDPAGAIIEDGFVWGPDKSSIYFAPLGLEGEFILPSTVSSIGPGTFLNCTSLTSVTIPAAVTSIGKLAFYSCIGLEKAEFASIESLCKIDFEDKSANPLSHAHHLYIGGSEVSDPVIPETVSSIGSWAFTGCNSITSVTIGNSVNTIGTSAFEDCSGLTSVIIPTSAKSIGSDAFKNCSGLKKNAYPNTISNPFPAGLCIAYNPQGAIVEDGCVWGSEKTALYFASLSLEGEFVIPNSVTSIGSSAFSGCNGMTSVIIGNSVSSIGSDAFSDCSGLTSLTIPAGVTSIGKNAFSGCNALNDVVYNAKNCTFGDGMKSPFPTTIKSLTLGDNVEVIPDYLAYQCSELNSLTIPDTVTSIGQMAFSGCSGLTSVTIPTSVTLIYWYAFKDCNSIKDVVYNAKNCTFGDTKKSPFPTTIKTLTFGDNVEVIPDYLAYQCSDLTSVTIPAGVTSIGEYAFSGCSGLNDVVYNAKNCTFGDSPFPTSIKTLTFGDNVEVIPDYLAYNCSNLNSVTIPAAVTSIGFSAFSGCSGLEKAEFASIESLCRIHFENKSANPLSNAHQLYIGGSEVTDVVIPETVNSIGAWSFPGCSNLASMTMGNSVTSIGADAFSGCTGLTSVTIGNSVNTIGRSAFSGCSGLTTVTIPAAVTSIGENAFSGCSGLTSVTIPAAVTSIGENAFSGCNGLIKSAYPNTISNPFQKGVCIAYNPEGALIEDGFIWALEKTALYFAPLSFEGEFAIPASVNTIGGNAFYGCSGLTSVTIPENVTSIGSYAFSGCSSLTSVTIPENVTSIDSYTFSGCSGMTSVTIPENVTSIGSYAFSGCSGLTSVTIPASVTSVGSSAFSDCSGLIKCAYPNTISNPFPTGLCIAYNAEGAFVEDGCVWAPEKTALYYAPLSLEGEFIIPASVNTVGGNSFYGCSGLTSVKSLSETAPAISTNSFEGLYDSVEAIVPDNSLNNYLTSNWALFENLTTAGGVVAQKFTDDVFRYRVNGEKSAMLLAGSYGNMTSASIPDRVVLNDEFYNVTYIGNEAFRDCSNLRSVSLPKNLEVIGEQAFRECTGLTSANIPESVKEIGRGAFYNCSQIPSLTLGNSVKSIGDYAFRGCSSLTTVEIPESVKELGKYAFAVCNNLASVTIPNSLSEISEGAFCENPALKTMTIPTSVTEIGKYAFYNTALSSVTIPNSVTAIGAEAFRACSNLKEFTVEDQFFEEISLGSAMLLDSPVTDLYMGRDWYTGDGFGTKLQRVTIGNTVSTIPYAAFRGCSNLKSVTLGSYVSVISSYAFANCNLSEVILSPATIIIGEDAFKGNNLKNIAMGANVTQIGGYAFDGANSLEKVSITAMTPPAAENTTFSNYDCPLYVMPSENNSVIDAYYNFTSCWYRFTGHNLVTINELKISGATEMSLKPGESTKLEATFSPADASLPYIFWFSTNPNIANVDNNGNVTMVGKGDNGQYCHIVAETLYADGPRASVIVTQDGSFVEEIHEDSSFSSSRSNDIYTIQGVCVKRNATDEDVKALTPGLYIIGGKKVMVK